MCYDQLMDEQHEYIEEPLTFVWLLTKHGGDDEFPIIAVLKDDSEHALAQLWDAVARFDGVPVEELDHESYDHEFEDDKATVNFPDVYVTFQVSRERVW